MTGSICYPGKGLLTVIVMIIALSILVFNWSNRPVTPEALFREKCSNCHELPSKKLCELPREIHPRIVDVMRTLHGAAAVIDEREASLIKTYLLENFSCP